MSVLVDPVEVRGKAGLTARPGMSLAEVMARMRWTRAVAKGLVDCGHLPSAKVVNPLNGVRQPIVEAEDLDQFDAIYVSLHALARERGLHHMTVKRLLDVVGAKPVFDIGQVPARFYRRADLPLP